MCTRVLKSRIAFSNKDLYRVLPVWTFGAPSEAWLYSLKAWPIDSVKKQDGVSMGP